MAESDGTYEIVWEKKPLGFSIVMDTSGKNAYVSSIQKEQNKQKGLKLAAQIIKINGENVKNVDHKEILQKIKSAQLPITLVFQPRSFANDPKKDEAPTPIIFEGAKVNQHRINGSFELTEQKCNGRCVWQRKDEETDPVLLWYWPVDQANNTTGKSLWMIGRKSHQNKEGAYACCPSEEKYPTQITTPWQTYDADSGNFVESIISIKQGKC